MESSAAALEAGRKESGVLMSYCTIGYVFSDLFFKQLV